MLSPRLLRMIEAAGPAFLRLLGDTWRVRVLPRGVDAARAAVGDHAIYAVWHGRLLIPTYCYRFYGVAIMVSQHGDGEIIARVVNRLGFHAIRGSTTRGGGRALRKAMRRASGGQHMAFTPDGPRGPRYVVQRGIVYAASRTGIPIVPCAVEADPAWVLGSWDEFTIPRPFARVVILQGDPLPVAPEIGGTEMEAARADVEARMHDLMGKARRLLSETC